MSQSNKSILDSLRDFWKSLFGAPATGAAPSTDPHPLNPPQHPPSPGTLSPQPDVPADPVYTPEPLVPMTPRVLVINYDPIVDKLKNLRLSQWGTQNFGWARIDQFTNVYGVDKLIQTYIDDIAQASGGMLKYQVVQRIDVDEFPAKVDGFRYTALDYINMYSNHRDQYHKPDAIDYYKVISDFKLDERVNNNEIDEVWLFTFPFSGTWESTMCGTGAFWCNSAPLANTSGRRYVIMGYSYERSIGEMEEDLGHRVESLMSRIYRCEDFVGWSYDFDRSVRPAVKRDPNKFDSLKYAAANDFAKFILFDKIAPGNSQCGTVHYAPNSDSDYDWGNNRPVLTSADNWLNFPNLTGLQKMENSNAWGSGDIRKHHRWWFERFPKVAGRINGIRSNWWHYIADVTDPEFDRPEGDSGGGIHVG